MKNQTYRSIALAVWCMVFVRAVHATTVAEFLGPYDSDLTGWALVFSLLGGGIRTILSWQGNSCAVRSLAREAAWDALKASVAGMAAFFLIQALRGSGWAIPVEMRVGLILLAGWHRLSALGWMQKFIIERINAYSGKQDSKPLDPPKETP